MPAWRPLLQWALVGAAIGKIRPGRQFATVFAGLDGACIGAVLGLGTCLTVLADTVRAGVRS